MEANVRLTILVAGSEPEMRISCQSTLQSLGHSVRLAQDESEALSCLGPAGRAVDAVVLDVVREEPGGLDCLRAIRELNPELPVIVVSGVASSENIVDAIKMGAADYLCKPVRQEHLKKAIRRAVGSSSPPVRLARSAAAAGQMFQGDSPSVRSVQDMVGRAGWSEAPVLIQGETGTGKEVVARQLHARSRRAGKPFLKINCAALPSELIESELFGYERGAFTGAVQKRLGVFEEADGGTLLLDEIGDMDCRLQSKLLHVLQDNSFLRVGGRELIQVNVRLMAATHCDLESAIANHAFREDLFYRLNVITIHLPPLRDRRADLLALTEFLMQKHATPQAPVPSVTADLKDALLAYDWPGNIRELENCVRKLLIFGDPESIACELRGKSKSCTRMKNIAADSEGQARTHFGSESLNHNERAETDAILAALNSTCWNRRRAAALLEIRYNSLRLKMKKLGIQSGAPIAFRAGGSSR